MGQPEHVLKDGLSGGGGGGAFKPRRSAIGAPASCKGTVSENYKEKLCSAWKSGCRLGCIGCSRLDDDI